MPYMAYLCTRSAQPLSALIEWSIHRNCNELLKWNNMELVKRTHVVCFRWAFALSPEMLIIVFPLLVYDIYDYDPRIIRWNRWIKRSGPDIRHEHVKQLNCKTHYRGHTRHIWGTDLIFVVSLLLTIGTIWQYYKYYWTMLSYWWLERVTKE